MGIEPISSVMAFQVQANVPQKQQSQQAPAEAEKPENSKSNSTAPVEYVDKTTKVVENAKEKGQSGGSGDQTMDQQVKDSQQMNHDRIRKAVEALNKRMAGSEAVFGIHDDTNRLTIKIVDKNTKEVIKELPPEKTLDMIARVWELAGLLVDERR